MLSFFAIRLQLVVAGPVLFLKCLFIYSTSLCCNVFSITVICSVCLSTSLHAYIFFLIVVFIYLLHCVLTCFCPFYLVGSALYFVGYVLVY